MFSKSCQYAIRATIFIAGESAKGERPSLKAIATAIDSPEAFTSKILQKLVRQGIIASSRGAFGGFSIASEEFEKIYIGEIVLAIDGQDSLAKCGLGLETCSDDHPCPLHATYYPVKGQMRHLLSSTSLADLLRGVSAGTTHLRI